MIVMKFGGSSVANAERIRAMAEIVRERLPSHPVVVLSAMGDTTDYLLEAAYKALTDQVSIEASLEKITEIHLNAARDLGLSKYVPDDLRSLLAELGALLAGISLIRELSSKTRDFLVSFGERLSVRLAALYFNKIGVKAKALDAWDAGFITNANFTSADILDEAWQRVPAAINPIVDAGILPVVTGFIAKSPAGDITTLGRGGSDLTATFIAAATNADEAEVWKDVDGIMTYDPRIVKTARPVAHVTYDEAAELAYFGAQVLHPRAMLPCSRKGIPVIVKNSYNPAAPGTRISANPEQNAPPVRALTSRTNITLIDIVSAQMLGASGFLGEVFMAFAKRGISVDMVATSEVSVSLTLDAAYNIEELKTDLSRIAHIEVKTDKAIVTIVCDVKQSSKILERAFGVCAALGVQVEMISQGASKVNISFIVNDHDVEAVVRGLHAAFFEATKQPKT